MPENVKESKRQVLGVTTVSHKFQVTIPKRVREKQKLEEGDLLMFIEEGSRIYVAKGSEV